MFSDEAAVALPTIDETAGGDSDEDADAADEPVVDQEEENLLAVQRVNMRRRTPITEDDFRDAYQADNIYKQAQSDWNHATKGPRLKKKWSLIKVQRVIDQAMATVKVTLGKPTVEYCPGVWDAEPHVKHDLERYRVTVCS